MVFEFTITPRVVAEAHGVLIVTDPVYPYDESPPIDVVMSHVTGSSIQWGSDPRIMSSTLSETAYLFLKVACHSLFLRSLNEVHRSSAIEHALIHPIFIQRILLFLGLVDFPASEPIHVVGPLGATFLRQRAAHLRVDPSVSRGASSSSIPPPPSSTGAAETSGAATATVANVPPPTTLDDSDIRRTLDHVLTV